MMLLVEHRTSGARVGVPGVRTMPKSRRVNIRFERIFAASESSVARTVPIHQQQFGSISKHHHPQVAVEDRGMGRSFAYRYEPVTNTGGPLLTDRDLGSYLAITSNVNYLPVRLARSSGGDVHTPLRQHSRVGGSAGPSMSFARQCTMSKLIKMGRLFVSRCLDACISDSSLNPLRSRTGGQYEVRCGSTMTG